MATISKSALHYIEDQLESKDALITDLEEELEAALEENLELKTHISRLMADRSLAVPFT